MSTSNAICIIDTSILDMILQINGQGTQEEFDEIDVFLGKKIDAGESLFLPIATILETGNHIHQMNDTVGDNKYKCANEYVDFIKKAINEEVPFSLLQIPEIARIANWIEKFPSEVYNMGFADFSIIQDWDTLSQQNPYKRVYIWSHDTHLQGYDRAPLEK